MADPEKAEQNPSKLEETLEGYRNNRTEHIILTPRVAHKVLFGCLLRHYREVATEPDPRIEVLIKIAEIASEEEIDFTDALSTYEENRRNETERQRQFEDAGKKIENRSSQKNI